MRNYILSIAVIGFITIQSACISAQEVSYQAPDVENLVESKNLVFKALTMMPSGGQSRQLNSNYDLRILGDSLVSFLPYIGRAYAAPLDPGASGLQFTSTQFDYRVRERRKKWMITITPRDAQDVRQMFLTVFENGNATLQVTSNYRQAISFNGRVERR